MRYNKCYFLAVHPYTNLVTGFYYCSYVMSDNDLPVFKLNSTSIKSPMQ